MNCPKCGRFMAELINLGNKDDMLWVCSKGHFAKRAVILRYEIYDDHFLYKMDG